MKEETAKLLRRARTLSVPERTELANALFESLDEALEESVKAAWDAEIVRRMEDLYSGSVKPVSLAEARRRFSSSLD